MNSTIGRQFHEHRDEYEEKDSEDEVGRRLPIWARREGVVEGAETRDCEQDDRNAPQECSSERESGEVAELLCWAKRLLDQIGLCQFEELFDELGYFLDFCHVPRSVGNRIPQASMMCATNVPDRHIVEEQYISPMVFTFYQRIGESDCEAIGNGFLAQPINAVSSLAFTVIGLLAIWWATRVTGNERAVRIVFGILMVLTGAGSVMFHGPQGPGSQFAHDVTFLVTVWFVAIVNIAQTLRWRRTLGWAVFVAGSAVLSVALVLSPGLTNVLMIATVISLVISDVMLHRIGRIRALWYVVSLVAILVAVVMFLLGRTGAPFCDPDSLFQGHGVWHLLGAIALGAYFVATSDSRASEGAGGRP